MAAKKECPGCAMEVDANRNTCPFCEYEFPQSRMSFKPVAILMLILFLYPLVMLIRRILASF
jgi:hypothetical protein